MAEFWRGSGREATVTVCPDLIGITHDPEVDRDASMAAYCHYVERLLVPSWGFMAVVFVVRPGVLDVGVTVRWLGRLSDGTSLGRVEQEVRRIAWAAAGNPREWVVLRAAPPKPPAPVRPTTRGTTLWVEGFDGTIQGIEVLDPDEVRAMMRSGFVTES